ncbi:MAG: Efflux transporter, RND family, MFP subunit, partial [Thermovirga lienii]
AAVFVVSGDVAVQKEVVLGESFNGYVRIISGLDGDEKVVVRGSDRLYPNAKIWLQGE